MIPVYRSSISALTANLTPDPDWRWPRRKSATSLVARVPVDATGFIVGFAAVMLLLPF